MRSFILGVITLSMAVQSWAQDQLAFDRPAGSAGAIMQIAAPDGQVSELAFGANQDIVINSRSIARSGDGVYRWQLSFAPQLSAQQQNQLSQVRGDGGGTLPANWLNQFATRSGSFALIGGQFVDGAAVDEPINPPVMAPLPPDVNLQVIAMDLIVQGSQCLGGDCGNTENFGSDTLRLKENNLRIHFDDTSNSGSFPNNDWGITLNDTGNGGANFFAITDRTANRDPIKLEAGAPANSLYVDDAGRVGLKTNGPAVELQIADGDTPTIRLQQTNAAGFAPLTWDVAGNETNFFVRDVDNGSLIPFKIRPNSPTNSLTLGVDDGYIGLGVNDASAGLHQRRGSGFTDNWLLFDSPDGDPTTEDRRMELDNSGNLFVSGTITQLSSRLSKTNFSRVTGGDVLSRLSSLPIWTWNYLTATTEDRHIGPVAEDFYAAFGFGQSERSLAPADVAGVALAATQALQEEVAVRDRKIEQLEERLARLEALLEADAQRGNR
ncbi:MAG: hypothetical protein Tsb002_35950 [Wenzhouxiangellaceae bacterium]